MLVRLLINAFIILVLPYLLSGIQVADFLAALIAALVLGLVNAVIRPVLLFFTLPLNVLTLGLFTFIVNALMLQLAAQAVRGFTVDGFWTALLGSLILSVGSSILSSLID